LTVFGTAGFNVATRRVWRYYLVKRGRYDAVRARQGLPAADPVVRRLGSAEG
jgi:hypothetical protein